jgi:hypothetical protein
MAVRAWPAGHTMDADPVAPISAGAGERANAQLKSWKVLRNRCCPLRATALVQTVQTLILTA